MRANESTMCDIGSAIPCTEARRCGQVHCIARRQHVSEAVTMELLVCIRGPSPSLLRKCQHTSLLSRPLPTPFPLRRRAGSGCPARRASPCRPISLGSWWRLQGLWRRRYRTRIHNLRWSCPTSKHFGGWLRGTHVLVGWLCTCGKYATWGEGCLPSSELPRMFSFILRTRFGCPTRQQ